LLVTGACLYVVWVAGTLIGVLFGPVLGDPKRFGLDAAFPAGFVALLWPLLSGRHAVRCAIAGGVVALVLAPFTPPGVPLAGAAVVGLWLAR
jgi:predicted branched-subunit amino acid permease